jgi:chromosome segregation protein
MRLKRLELQGFKSFMDRTILTFDSSVTGVVGPNGCGKSNIVDAILWVMGEQSPKHLRGHAMTDVIFNGAEGKSAVSMAEVSLILDRKGVPLAPQFAAFEKGDEIAITRRIFRDGTNEYLLNKISCRLKDIHELFMDTGVGRRAYSIIEQGQIDRMINVKPEDRRMLFEEVAGITKYKAKRKEAEKKLESTRQNLTRLQDIINELDKRIRTLKVQATRAKRYKELKIELETVDLFLMGRKLHDLAKSIADLEAEKTAKQNERSESDARAGEIDAELTQLEVKRVDQEQEYAQLSQRERELSLLVQKLESDLNLFEERRKNLNASLETGREEEAQIDETVNALIEESDKSATEKANAQSELSQLESGIDEQEEKLREIQEERVQIERRRGQLQNQRNSLMQKEASLKKQVEHGETRSREAAERREELNQRLAEIVASLEGFKAELEEVDKQIQANAEQSRDAESGAANLSTECQTISKQLSDLEDALFELRETFHTRRSRHESLKELQENLEGYSPTAREILLKLQEAAIPAQPLAEVVQPDAEVEEKLEMLLGADMNTLLVNEIDQAKELARLIQERGLERVRVVALSEMPAAVPTADIEGARPLLSRVRVTPGFEAAAHRWLGDVYLVDTWESLFSLRAQYPDKTFLAADTGAVAHRDRSVTAGALPTKMGVFARRREIEELDAACRDLQAQVDAKTQEQESLLQKLQEQEKLRDDIKERLSELHIKSVEFRKTKESAQQQLVRTERDYNAVQGDAQRNEALLAQYAEDVDKSREELAGLAGEDEAFRLQIDEAEQEIAKANERASDIASELNERRVDISRLEERVTAVGEKLDKLNQDVAQATRRKESIRDRRSRDEQELGNLDHQAADVTSRKSTSEGERNEILVLQEQSKQAHQETSYQIATLRDQASDINKNRQEVLEKLQQVELALAQANSEVGQLKLAADERYQSQLEALGEAAKVDIGKLPLFQQELNVTFELLVPKEQATLLEEYLGNIRAKVARYGEVNLTAIQEFDEIQGRFDFLMTQKTDLEKAITILEEAIQKINESTKLRFEETFHAVDKKFREIFPILFNGGKAELALIVGENPLDAGVDIMVQPPGKRLQSISLLSGGEKALTAVSLVLSIFARKPSPFCLLDEVDAPLDDANVSRFNTVIRKMSEKTQFIVITHNKKTMEIADALYGVTMERAGVSRMASVRLN